MVVSLQTARNWLGLEVLASEMVSRDGTDGGAALLLGYARLQQGKVNQAIEALSLSSRLSPEEIDVWVLLGEAQRIAGRRPEAMRTLHHARSIDPFSPAAPFLLGEIHLQSGDPQSALISYQEAVQVSQEFAPAWLGLYRTYRQLGKQAEMQAALDALKRLDPALAAQAASLP